MCSRALPALAVVALVSATGLVRAAERAQGPHVHGAGQINVALEGRFVEIELTVPGANIVGFEHRAESPADKASIERASAVLKAGDRLFRFPDAARCRLVNATVEAERDEDDDHDDAASADDHEEEGHAEFRAQYRFDCAQPARATYIDVLIFGQFSSIQKLGAQTISGGRQGAQMLTAAMARLKL